MFPFSCQLHIMLNPLHSQYCKRSQYKRLLFPLVSIQSIQRIMVQHPTHGVRNQDHNVQSMNYLDSYTTARVLPSTFQ